MDVALVGLVLPGIENHSLAALQRAVRAEGREVTVVAFDGFASMERTIRDVLRSRAAICGVSIQTSESILAAMCLTRLLRERGYRGRIVCGGHFATLHARELLELDAGVDAVVRFAGEEALVALLQQTELQRVPGANIDADGNVVSFEGVVPDGGVVPLPEELRACLEAWFANFCYPEAAGHEVRFEQHGWIA